MANAGMVNSSLEAAKEETRSLARLVVALVPIRCR